MQRRGVPLIIFLILLLNEVLDSFAQYSFKKCADAQGSPVVATFHDALSFAIGAMGSGYLWVGLAALSVVFVSWTAILAKLDLSVASPITSLSYVFVALTSILFLHEHVSLLRWAGIACILAGVAVVSYSAEKKKEES